MVRSLLPLAALLPALAAADCNNVQGACSKQNIQANNCNLVNNMSEEQVETACKLAEIPFSSITQLGFQNDLNFMNGATTEFGKNAEDMDVKKGRLDAYQMYTHSSKKVGWPEYNAGVMPQFDMDETCDLETVVCCYTDTEGIGADAQVCHHDIHESHQASRLYRGFAAFDNNLQAKCYGFTWANDATTEDFKGNMLAELSYGKLADLDGNVPGAPMCGCIEHMPAITAAEYCTPVVQNEAYSIESDATLGIIVIPKGTLSVTYECDGDLLLGYKGTDADKKAKLEEKLVGTCDTDKFLNHYFYQPGSASVWDEPDPNHWQKMMGQGLNYVPFRDPNLDVRNAAFMEVFNNSDNKIIMRRCPQCMKSHQFIYYVRKQPVAPATNLMNLLMDDWVSADNTLGVHFDLYSTYEEALAGNGGEWTWCNYDDGTGFPRDCGPNGRVNCQWNSHKRTPCSNGDYNTFSHAFYIDISPAAAA